MAHYKFYKCSVETYDEYRSAGFIVRERGNIEDKLVKFFKKTSTCVQYLKYDGVYLPLTECHMYDLDDLNYVFKESIFGNFYRIK